MWGRECAAWAAGEEWTAGGKVGTINLRAGMMTRRETELLSSSEHRSHVKGGQWNAPFSVYLFAFFSLKVSLFWFIEAIYLINKIWHIFTSPFCKKGGKISAFPSLDLVNPSWQNGHLKTECGTQVWGSLAFGLTPALRDFVDERRKEQIEIPCFRHVPFDLLCM